MLASSKRGLLVTIFLFFFVFFLASSVSALQWNMANLTVSRDTFANVTVINDSIFNSGNDTSLVAQADDINITVNDVSFGWFQSSPAGLWMPSGYINIDGVEAASYVHVPHVYAVGDSLKLQADDRAYFQFSSEIANFSDTGAYVVDMPTEAMHIATKQYVDDNAGGNSSFNQSFTDARYLHLDDNASIYNHSHLTDLVVPDDHTQYALLAGRSGGQILMGGTDPGDDLTLFANDEVPVSDGSVIVRAVEFYPFPGHFPDLGTSSSPWGNLYLRSNAYIKDEAHINIGDLNEWMIFYDENNDDQLRIVGNVGQTTISQKNPLYHILINTSITAGQQVFGIGNGTYVDHTDLLLIDDLGNVYVAGNFNLSGIFEVDTSNQMLSSNTDAVFNGSIWYSGVSLNDTLAAISDSWNSTDDIWVVVDNGTFMRLEDNQSIIDYVNYLNSTQQQYIDDHAGTGGGYESMILDDDNTTRIQVWDNEVINITVDNVYHSSMYNKFGSPYYDLQGYFQAFSGIFSENVQTPLVTVDDALLTLSSNEFIKISPAGTAEMNFSDADGAQVYAEPILDMGVANKGYIDTRIPASANDGVMLFGSGGDWAQTSTSELYWKDSTKQLSMGTTNPQYLFEIYTGETAAFGIYNTAAGDYSFSVDNDNAAVYVGMQLIVDGASIDAYNDINDFGQYLRVMGNNPYMEVKDSGSDAQKLTFRNANGASTINYFGGDLSFKDQESTTTMIIKDSSGNVGINSASPTTKLDVGGTTKLQGNVTVGAGTVQTNMTFTDDTGAEFCCGVSGGVWDCSAGVCS